MTTAAVRRERVVFGIDAEGKSFEDVTKPLTSTSETELPPETPLVPATP